VELFQYDFMQRALMAGLITSIVCPMIGMFVVVRRQSMIGDGLGHIAFAGVTGGFLIGLYPVASAAMITVVGAILIELIRQRNSQYADMGLAVIFYTGAALAIIFSTIVRIPSSSMLGFLFGSIMTVSSTDLITVSVSGLVVCTAVLYYFDQLTLAAFDEEIAAIAGVNTFGINVFFSVITALVVVIGMTVVGILLVSALMIVPVAAAHSLKLGFRATLGWAMAISTTSMFVGLVLSFYLDIAPGGTIVMTAVGCYMLTALWQYIVDMRNKSYRSGTMLSEPK
jgi:zinc transport system permease protein